METDYTDLYAEIRAAIENHGAQVTRLAILQAHYGRPGLAKQLGLSMIFLRRYRNYVSPNPSHLMQVALGHEED